MRLKWQKTRGIGARLRQGEAQKQPHDGNRKVRPWFGDLHHARDLGDDWGCLRDERDDMLRECRKALDELINGKPGIEAMQAGSTTIGNLRAELYKWK